MTTPPAAVAVTGLPMALGLALAGLATASAAITLAMSDPPPGLQGRNAAYNYYPQLALAAGVAELGAAAWWMADPRGRTAAGMMILCATGGIAAAKLFWPGCF